MSDGFEIKYEFVEKWASFANPEHFRIYVYILMRYKKDGIYLSKEEIAIALRIGTDLIEEALGFWAAVGYISYQDGSYTFLENKKDLTRKTSTRKAHLRMRPSYTQSEIDAAATVNEQIDYMFKQAEKILEKILSPSDYEMLYSFVDWLGLPVEVVIMLLQFGARQGKTGKRYLETVAIDWADKGIDTYESAEEYIREIELKLSNEGKVRGILGIYDRALTQTEKKYIGLWVGEKKISPELIAAAYDRTVAATGKLSWAYMNKILESWKEQCFETVEQVRANEEMFKIKNSPTKKKENGKKSKFNNYEDTNKPDYSNFAEEILSDMLEE